MVEVGLKTLAQRTKIKHLRSPLFAVKKKKIFQKTDPSKIREDSQMQEQKYPCPR